MANGKTLISFKNNITGAGNQKTEYIPVSADPVKKLSFEKGETILALYRVESDAIKGGMGQVHRVHHLGWDVDLAMKRPHAHLFQTPEQKELFIRECETWIGLGLHPHIVSCYYVREIDGVPSIFAEWMDGGSLKDWISSGRLYWGSEQETLERILDISIQFARGLRFAHDHGLIHQDVKPDNLMMSDSGKAKVADFGISKARAMLTTINAASATDGTMALQSGAYTPAYASIEQINGEKLTRRTDIFSWAVSVMEMFVGKRQWNSGAVAGLACEEYFPMAKVAIPDTMKTLLAHCMNENEAERPHSFSEIEAELLRIYSEQFSKRYIRMVPKAAADTADSLNNRALSFIDMGKSDQADSCWTKALELDPKHSASIYNRTLLRWRMGELSDLQIQEYLYTEIPYYLEGIRAIESETVFASILSSADEPNGKKQWNLKPRITERITPDGLYIIRECDGGSTVSVLKKRLWKQDFEELYKTPHRFIDDNDNCFIPEKHLVLMAREDRLESFSLIDYRTGEVYRTFIGAGAKSSYCVFMLRSADISRSNRLIVTGDNNNEVRVWNIETAQCVSISKTFLDLGLNFQQVPICSYVKSVRFADDEHYVISNDDTHSSINYPAVFGNRAGKSKEGYDVYRFRDAMTGQVIRTSPVPFPKDFAPGPKAQLRLSKIQDTDERLDKDAEFERVLLSAQVMYEVGEMPEALHRIMGLRKISGYENNVKALELCGRIGEFFRRRWLNGLILIGEDKSWTDKPQLEEALQIKAREACGGVAEFFLEEYRKSGDAYSEYDFGFRQALKSPDGRFIACPFVIKEERDSPAQLEIEVTDDYFVAILEAVEKRPLMCGHAMTKSAYGNEYPFSMEFSADSNRIYVAGENLRYMDISGAGNEDYIPALPANAVYTAYVPTCGIGEVHYAAATKDGRYLLCHCGRDTMVLISAATHEELFSTRIVDGLVKAMRLNENDTELYMLMDDDNCRRYFLDWDYEQLNESV